MTTITLTLICTEAERAAIVARFIETAQAVTGEVDDGLPGDPNGSKVDTAGVVWDARYHGANMSKNQDGTWRRKKNLSAQEKTDADNYEAGCKGAPSVVAQVAAGIVAQAAVGVTQSLAAPAADVPAFLQTGTFAPTAAAPIMGMPGMPAAAPFPVAPVAPPAPAPVSFPELIAAFQAAAVRLGGEAALQSVVAGVYERSGVTTQDQLENDSNVRIRVKAELEALKA